MLKYIILIIFTAIIIWIYDKYIDRLDMESGFGLVTLFTMVYIIGVFAIFGRIIIR